MTGMTAATVGLVSTNGESCVVWSFADDWTAVSNVMEQDTRSGKRTEIQKARGSSTLECLRCEVALSFFVGYDYCSFSAH